MIGIISLCKSLEALPGDLVVTISSNLSLSLHSIRRVKTWEPDDRTLDMKCNRAKTLDC